MGCAYSSRNRIQSQESFTSDDILYLNQSWNILKNHDITKLGDEVLIKTMRRNSSFRNFWASRLVIDSNNFDFSQGESCLRTELSWRIGLRDHSIQLIHVFNQLLTSLKDENLLLTQIRSLRLLQNISIFEYNFLTILTDCIIETIRERFQLFKYDFAVEYERAWQKFLSFIIKILLEKDNQARGPMKIIISPATISDRPSTNIAKS